ncbi:hypothetical protein HGRIS_014929 [Hohenbuehelia grisea]|uniref:Uncharacterized protein n=1 Tax=Hohenbuehelia grisea TaxID=104357 RepID=A0ABR3JXV6_9AGAR
MPSFKTLSVIATFCFAAFAGATPMPAPCASIGNCNPTPPPPPPTCSTSTCNPKPLPDIIKDCHQSLTPLCSKLSTAINLKIGVDLGVQIKPIIEEIKVVLKVAIDEAKACTGHPTKAILTVTVKELSVLISKLLVLIFGSIGAVISTCGVVRVKVVLPLLVEVAAQVAILLEVVLGLVGGLVVGIIPGIAGVLQVILFLNVGSLLKCLNLKAILGINLGLGIF